MAEARGRAAGLMRLSGVGILALAPLAWAAGPGETTWQYDVVPSADSKKLDIEATFPAGLADPIKLEDEAPGFTANVAIKAADRWRALPREGTSWVAAGCASGCRVRYRFELGRLARADDDVNRAEANAAMIVSAPDNWLLRPSGGDGDAKLRLRVEAPAGRSFAIGWPPVPNAPGTFEARAQDMTLAPYAAFGAFDVRTAAIGDRELQVAIGSEQPPARAQRVRAWAKSSAEAIRQYAGHFPIDHALVVVLSSRGHSLNGRTIGSGGATVVLWLGADATADEMNGDWVLVHELSHLMLPSVPRRCHWMEEGLATYVEPLARLRGGTIQPASVWAQLLWGLPKGLPDPDDEGLDNTPTWGRTYWGGALFWFLADVRIRERTKNRCSIQDALRSLEAAGGNLGEQWPVSRVLKAADRGVGGSELEDLYAEMAPRPAPVHLDDLMARLGVSAGKDGPAFDDAAPLAWIRKGITSIEPSACKPDGG
jgi:hypothetical protein